MSNDTNEQWLSRQDLADRYGLPVKISPSGLQKEQGRHTHEWVGTCATASATSPPGKLRGSRTYVKPPSQGLRRGVTSKRSRMRPPMK
jgi:hypothetical protein